MAHPPRIPVWLGQDEPVVYFLTLNEIDRRPVWDNERFFDAFQTAVQKLADRGLWFVRSAIVMPDHLHVLASPWRSRDDKVGNLTGALKRWTKKEFGAPNWDFQPGGFDRLLRRGESAEEKWNYMRNNPVRAGLVSAWKDGPWSIGIRQPTDNL